MTNVLQLTNLSEDAARKLSNALISAALTAESSTSGTSRFIFTDLSSSLLQQLKAIIGDIERLSPGKVGELRQRLSEYDKVNEERQGPWAKYNELFHSGSAESLVEASKTAPSEIADRLLKQAVWKAENGGDAQAARRIAEKIADPRQRADTITHLDRQESYRARSEKKVTEARAAIARLPVAEERAVLLAQLAASTDGDKSTALALLAEAQSLLGDRARNYAHFGALLQIANTYLYLDQAKGTQIIESVIEQVNELAVAALVLSGFDVQHYFKDGEFIISASTPLTNVIQESARHLGTITNKDFERARVAADRLQRSEMRVMALLRIVQTVLESADQ